MAESMDQDVAQIYGSLVPCSSDLSDLGALGVLGFLDEGLAPSHLDMLKIENIETGWLRLCL